MPRRAPSPPPRPRTACGGPQRVKGRLGPAVPCVCNNLCGSLGRLPECCLASSSSSQDPQPRIPFPHHMQGLGWTSLSPAPAKRHHSPMIRLDTGMNLEATWSLRRTERSELQQDPSRALSPGLRSQGLGPRTGTQQGTRRAP